MEVAQSGPQERFQQRRAFSCVWMSCTWCRVGVIACLASSSSLGVAFSWLGWKLNVGKRSVYKWRWVRHRPAHKRCANAVHDLVSQCITDFREMATVVVGAQGRDKVTYVCQIWWCCGCEVTHAICCITSHCTSRGVFEVICWYTRHTCCVAALRGMPWFQASSVMCTDLCTQWRWGLISACDGDVPSSFLARARTNNTPIQKTRTTAQHEKRAPRELRTQMHTRALFLRYCHAIRGCPHAKLFGVIKTPYYATEQ